jgi:hypothetical protein
MSFATGPGYEFGEDLPIEPIQPGSTVLVAGPALSRAEDLALSMVADASATDGDEGMLFISTNMTCEKLLGACGRTHETFDPAWTGVIDCSGQDLGQFRSDAEVKTVSTQSDLTGIGMKFSALYESLYGAAQDGRVRTGLVTLSSLSMYVDMRSLFRFAQTLSGRIDSADGLGVFAIDPTTHDTKTVNTFSQVADGRIEVREPEDHPDADGELRVRGLPDQPSGWQPFSLS